MRVSIISPGPDWSVRDVLTGHMAGLQALGHEVRLFDLSVRLKFYAQALRWTYLRSGKHQEDGTVARLASEKIVVEAVRYQPDLVHVVSGMSVHPIAYSDLKRAGFRISLYLTECPYDDGRVEPALQFVDYLFVNDKASVAHYAARGIQAHYLPHAYNPAVHYPQEVAPEYRSDVFFVGTGFPERIRLLEAVDWTGIDLKLRGFWQLAPDSPLQKFYQGGVVDNAEAARYYCGARICLNLYRTSIGYGTEEHVAPDLAYSLNPRAYELAACGAFQLSEPRPEIAEVFGDSVPTFANAAELEAQIRHMLAQPLGRKHLAYNARQQVLRQGCTFEDRMREMLAVIEGSKP